MTTSGSEEPDAQGLVEAGREEVVGPGGELLGGEGQIRRAQRRAVPIDTGDLDVVRRLRPAQEGDDAVVQVDAGQRAVAAPEGVGEGEPGGVERDDGPQ